MIHFETYHVHIYKPVTEPWTDAKADESAMLVDDAELCALLEAVTVLYLKQRGPLAHDLIVGASLPYAAEGKGYERPFMTDSLGLDTRPMLRGMLAELDAMAGQVDGLDSNGDELPSAADLERLLGLQEGDVT